MKQENTLDIFDEICYYIWVVGNAEVLELADRQD